MTPPESPASDALAALRGALGGQYTIERAGSSPSVFVIRRETGKTATAAFVATRPAGHHAPASDMPALQFKKSENEYKLSAVWESRSDGQIVID